MLEWAAETLAPRRCDFVGGHPMAGKTQSIEGADADLFSGATWCVAPSVTASEDAVRTVLGLIAAAGAEPFFIDPHEHDAYVAGVSHLPFVLSAALMNTVVSRPIVARHEDVDRWWFPRHDPSCGGQPGHAPRHPPDEPRGGHPVARRTHGVAWRDSPDTEHG